MPAEGITCDELSEIFYLSAAFNGLISSSDDGSNEFSALDLVRIIAQLPDQYPPPLLASPWLALALDSLSVPVEGSEEDADESETGSTDIDGIRAKMGLEKFILTYVTK